MELNPLFDDNRGNRAIEIRKRINGVSVIATIEKGENKEFLVTSYQFVKSDALDASKETPGLNVRNDSDIAKVQQEIETIKESAKNASKVVDENGEPKEVYHGTMAMFNTFVYNREDIGFHFGTKGTARRRVGRGKGTRIIETFLNIKNPIEFDEDLGSWDADYLVKSLMEKGLMTYEDANSIMITPEGYKRNSTDALIDLRKWMEANGYDGIIYPNWYESDGKPSYLTFKKNQIKSSTDNIGTYDGENGDIRFSRKGRDRERTCRHQSKGYCRWYVHEST